MTDENVSPLPGVNVLLQGPSGTGKTFAIKTLIEAGITPFCMFLEPGFEVLGDVPAEKLKWRFLKPAKVTWDTLEENHRKLNTLNFESLSKMPPTDKRDYFQFVELHRSLNNFTCDRTGEQFGDVCTWNTDRALVIDGLSGLNTLALREWVGSKNLLAIGDWGVAMNGLEQFIQKCCMDTQCHFILIAHTEREVTEDTGASRIMVSTLGKKLAPKFPRWFSDVVMSVRNADKFSWTTADSSAELKARNLPIRDNLPPSFVQIIETWKKHSGKVLPTPPYVPKVVPAKKS